MSIQQSVAAFHRGGSGEPMVLLHGFTSAWRAWTPVLPALEEHFEVFAPTLPGHLGAQPFPIDAEVTVAAFVDLLECQLDAQGIEKAHFVGNSFGGWLSLELALRGRALSVTGLCPAGGWEPRSREERATFRFFRRTTRIALPLSKPFFAVLANRPALRAIAMRDMVSRPAQMDAALALATLAASSGCAVASGMLAASKRGDLFGELGEIECPITIATANKDRLLKRPSYFAKFRRILPSAIWVELDGLGHLPMSDDPKRVVEVIIAGTGGESRAADEERG
jgi:pimeloyl-ACP methyl ester carboxylesterase